MHNKDIIALLKDTAQLLELHGANPFQVRHYTNAALQLSKLDQEVAGLSLEELKELAGIAPSAIKFMQELNETGTLQRWEELNAATPQGVRAMLSLRGIGPKKVNALWKELGIESLEALEQACEAGTIAQLPGFGPKTQATIQASLAFKAQQVGKFHYATALPYATALEKQLQETFPTSLVSLAGALRRKMEVVEKVDILIGTDQVEAVMEWLDQQPLLQKNPQLAGPFSWRGQFEALALPLHILCCAPDRFYQQLMLHTGSTAHLALLVQDNQPLGEVVERMTVPHSEAVIYTQAGLPYIPPELREGQIELAWAQEKGAPSLLAMQDLRGVFHNHTTYSDGKDSLETMARYCQEVGYEYIGITDHSQSAHYAGGLTPAEIERQHQEIDRLNEQLAPFKIFKGIESDILGNGALDYPADILARFDFVIASVHIGMNMDRKTATERVIKAIRNPYTTILAHLTNRLLLKREGFPVDYRAIIDACAECGVVIEINSNPWRLELDWRWIDYALYKNVQLSINPDAHDKESIQNMYYGVCVARKGGLTPAHTFNALSREDVAQYLQHRKSQVMK
ncbi:MAG: helix-hairpin-helix domain-containing protein [Bacteroidota bacterium]